MDRGRDAPLARERLSRALLLALLLVIGACAARVSWHSSTSVDNRTYLEMIVGIAQHGLPYTANGPLGRYPELQARWNRVADGRLWGALPPVFPYVATPVFLAGGVRGVIRFNIALLGALAVAAYLLTRRLARDPLAGAAAAYLTVLATPVTSLALDTSPYVWAIAAATWAAYFGLRAIDDVSRRAALLAAAACGALGGLAAGAHPLAFPSVAALVATLGFASARSVDAAARGPFDLPWLGVRVRRESLEQFAAASGGFVAVLLPVALLNRVRFESWNPITYGPCVWRSCAETGLDRQSIGDMLWYAAPVAAWCAGVLLLHALLRGAPLARRLAVAACVLAVVPPSTLHDRAFGLATMLWAFVADLSGVTLGFGFVRPADGLGNFLGPWVVKAALQSSPFLCVAALTGLAPVGRARAAVLGLPAVALLAALAMRASLPNAFALGFPYLNLRYVVPAMPVLTVLAVVVSARLPWRWREVAFGALVAAVGGWYLGRADSDADWTRRAVMLWGTLALALATFVAVGRALVRDASRARARVAALLIAAAAGYGVAVNMAVDLRSLLALRREHDRRIDEVARQTPARFALVGWPPEIDGVLALRATRDIHYADLYEGVNWANFRSLIDVWAAERRPIYALFPIGRAFTSPWPEIEFVVIDRALGLHRVDLRAPPRP